MMFSELVCSSCRKILTYPLSAISCCCRSCGTFNAALNMVIKCECCEQNLLAPVNAVTVVCPCCLSIIDIPLELLPEVNPAPNNAQSELEKLETMYISCPTIGKHFDDKNDSNLNYISTLTNRGAKESKSSAAQESTLATSCAYHAQTDEVSTRNRLATLNSELSESKLSNNRENTLQSNNDLIDATAVKCEEHHVASGAEMSEKARRVNRNVLIATRIL